jgi:uncharacterized membrane protein
MTALDQAYLGVDAGSPRLAQEQWQSPWRRLQQRQGRSSRVNVGRAERTVCVAAGSIVAIQGLTRGTLSGILSAAAGAAMVARGATGYCPGYAAAGIDTNRDGASTEAKTYQRGVSVDEAFLINRPAADLYSYWRNFENLPRIMSHLESVRVTDDRRSSWVAKAPRIAGGTVSWDAEIVRDEPNEVIRWRSLAGSDVDVVGEVRFIAAPGDRGTEVHVSMSYMPPAGRLGHWVAKMFGEAPTGTVREDLRNFKRIMECGEIPTLVGQPRGTCTGQGKRETA